MTIPYEVQMRESKSVYVCSFGRCYGQVANNANVFDGDLELELGKNGANWVSPCACGRVCIIFLGGGGCGTFDLPMGAQ